MQAGQCLHQNFGQGGARRGMPFDDDDPARADGSAERQDADRPARFRVQGVIRHHRDAKPAGDHLDDRLDRVQLHRLVDREGPVAQGVFDDPSDTGAAVEADEVKHAGNAAAPERNESEAEEEQAGLPPAVWIAGLIGLMTILVFVFAG